VKRRQACSRKWKHHRTTDHAR